MRYFHLCSFKMPFVQAKKIQLVLFLGVFYMRTRVWASIKLFLVSLILNRNSLQTAKRLRFFNNSIFFMVAFHQLSRHCPFFNSALLFRRSSSLFQFVVISCEISLDTSSETACENLSIRYVFSV